MQKLYFKNAVSPIDVAVVFQSRYYTVARAIVDVENGDGQKREVFAEGIARRSWLDADDRKLGADIAGGRAKKALALKLNGEKIYVHKAKDLFMNG